MARPSRGELCGEVLHPFEHLFEHPFEHPFQRSCNWGGGRCFLTADGAHLGAQVDQAFQQIGLQQRKQRLVQRDHFQRQQRIVQASHAAAIERIAKQIPAMIRVWP